MSRDSELAPAAVATAARRRVPPVSRLLPVVAGVAAAVVVVLMLLGHFSDYEVYTTSTIGVYAIAALGQDWLIGHAGQVSLGGAAFMAVGAFTVAGTTGTPLGSWPIQLIMSGIFGAAFGFVVGLPALRLRGMYLLLSTLAFQFMMLFITNEYQGNRPIGFEIAPPHIGSWTLDTDRQQLGLVAAVLLVCCLFSYGVQHHAPGRYWRSLRESEPAAASLGIPVARWKLLAFVGSSAQTAVAGALLAMLLGLVTFDIFSFTLALTLGVMVFLGGRSTITGPILGAIAVTLLPNGLSDVANSIGSSGAVGGWISTNEALLVTGIYGLALLLVLLLEPDGIVGLLRLAGSVPGRVRAGRLRAGEKAAKVAKVAATSTAISKARTTEPEPAGKAADMTLATGNLTVRYPNGAIGIEDFSISVQTGSIVVLVGRNGAGKTTALRALAGYPRAERMRLDGTIRIGSEEVKQHDPVTMRGLGVVLVPERNKVFPTLTVTEHLRLAGLGPVGIEAVMERFTGLSRLATRRAGLLSGGERQLLALAAATAVNPRLLLIDEPSLGLSPVATQALVAELMRLRDESGLTVLLTEQVTETVEAVADHFFVLERGHVLMSGDAGDLRRPDVRAAVMGR
jgi:branched-chain amino acid transport system permease protein